MTDALFDRRFCTGGLGSDFWHRPQYQTVAVSTGFIFALFPLPNALIDERLIAIDAALGYHWPGFVAGLARFRVLAKALRYLYQTSLPQILPLEHVRQKWTPVLSKDRR